MLNPSLRRKLVILSLAGALLLPVLATAAPRSRRAVRPEASQPVAAGFLKQLGATLVALWNAAGCELDPSGLCVDNPGDPGTAGVQTGPGSGSGLGAQGNPLDQYQ